MSGNDERRTMSGASAVGGGWPRVIAHADMDAFYAAIEQLDDPSLRGRPILVGPPSARGVVLTASYEARPYGVGSAMPMARARRMCPQALIVPPRFARYAEVSAIVMRTFADFSPSVEALSLDEAFIDLTGTDKLLGAPAAIARRLKDAVREATGGLTVSVGIASNKYVAKVASGFAKPDGLTIVAPQDARAWLAPLPVAALWGAGPKTVRRLEALSLKTIGDVARCDVEELEAALGSMGRRFAALARAEDPRSVVAHRAAHSLGAERTLERDVTSHAEIATHLRASADTIARRLRRHGLVAAGVRLKLKRSDFKVLTRQCRLAAATDLAAELFSAAARLLAALDESGPFRLVGLAVYEIAAADRTKCAEGSPQLGLGLPAGGGNARGRALENALDRVVERFGAGAIGRAAELTSGRGVGGAPNLDFLNDVDEGSN